MANHALDAIASNPTPFKSQVSELVEAAAGLSQAGLYRLIERARMLREDGFARSEVFAQVVDLKTFKSRKEASHV